VRSLPMILFVNCSLTDSSVACTFPLYALSSN